MAAPGRSATPCNVDAGLDLEPARQPSLALGRAGGRRAGAGRCARRGGEPGLPIDPLRHRRRAAPRPALPRGHRRARGELLRPRRSAGERASTAADLHLRDGAGALLPGRDRGLGERAAAHRPERGPPLRAGGLRRTADDGPDPPLRRARALLRRARRAGSAPDGAPRPLSDVDPRRRRGHGSDARAGPGERPRAQAAGAESRRDGGRALARGAGARNPRRAASGRAGPPRTRSGFCSTRSPSASLGHSDRRWWPARSGWMCSISAAACWS